MNDKAFYCYGGKIWLGELGCSAPINWFFRQSCFDSKLYYLSVAVKTEDAKRWHCMSLMCDEEGVE